MFKQEIAHRVETRPIADIGLNGTAKARFRFVVSIQGNPCFGKPEIGIREVGIVFERLFNLVQRIVLFA